MKLVVGGDPNSLVIKEFVRKHLLELGYKVDDLGSKENTPVPYYEVGYRVGKAISEQRYDFGFVMCGSGMGVNLVANMFPKVFCAVCESIYTAGLARAVNDANVLAMGANIIAPPLACKMVDAFLTNKFIEDFKDGDPDFTRKAVETIRGYEKELYR